MCLIRTLRSECFCILYVLLDSGPPEILNLVIGSSWQMLCDFGPPALVNTTRKGQLVNKILTKTHTPIRLIRSYHGS